MSDARYVVLHIGTGPSDAEVTTGSPLIVTDTSARFKLSDELWIERLDEGLAKRIQLACEPANHKTDSFVVDRHLYAFVRCASDAEVSKYGGMGELYELISLSRLVHPTSMGDRYSAFMPQSPSDDSPIWAIQYRGLSPDVFLTAGHRDWLSVDDGNELCKLIPWLSKKKHMHERVQRAYWNHEYAMRTAYLDMRLPLIVSGLEALINVGKDDNNWQFRSRVRQLAERSGINLTDADLENAWQLRSKIVHGESFLYGLSTVLPNGQHSGLYDKLERTLRTTVRDCLLDEAFGNRFCDDDAVRANWALGTKPSKPVRNK